MQDDTIDSNESKNYINGVQALEDLIKIQCSDGNWNHDEYMHGMANGMILTLSLFKNGDVDFLEAPKVWGKDIHTKSNIPSVATGDENNV